MEYLITHCRDCVHCSDIVIDGMARCALHNHDVWIDSITCDDVDLKADIW